VQCTYAGHCLGEIGPAVNQRCAKVFIGPLYSPLTTEVDHGWVVPDQRVQVMVQVAQTGCKLVTCHGSVECPYRRRQLLAEGVTYQ